MNRNRNHFNLNIMKCFKNDLKWAKSMLKNFKWPTKIFPFLMKICQFSEFFLLDMNWLFYTNNFRKSKISFLTEIQKLKIFLYSTYACIWTRNDQKTLMEVIILAVNCSEIEVFHRKRVSKHTVCIKLWFLWWSVKDGYHWSSLYNIINRVGPVRAD